jgi:two-component system chemotaxis response regulator CheY
MSKGRKLRILVVDDEPTMRLIIQGVLNRCQRLDASFDVSFASDGEHALELLRLRGKQFDLIISDWYMPNVTGLELLKTVQGDPQLSSTPFLMVTSEDKAGKVAQAIDGGVRNYIIKPFTAELFEEKLIQLLGPSMTPASRN